MKSKESHHQEPQDLTVPMALDSIIGYFVDGECCRDCSRDALAFLYATLEDDEEEEAQAVLRKRSTSEIN